MVGNNQVASSRIIRRSTVWQAEHTKQALGMHMDMGMCTHVSMSVHVLYMSMSTCTCSCAHVHVHVQHVMLWMCMRM